jgi:hypothetical protein
MCFLVEKLGQLLLCVNDLSETRFVVVGGY